MKRVIVLLVLVLAACGGEHRAAREIYNQGVAALAKGEYEQAQKLLLDARSQAGVDPELRFRAAYDLGLAYAAHADKLRVGQEADLAKALELAQQAMSWLSDATHLRPEHEDARTNLAIVRARVQAISDELRKGEGSLEARLDALITDQRALLDDARGAWLAIKQAGGTDPLAQQGTLTHLADRERGIVAEAGVLTDLAADEIDAIGKKPEDKRSQEEKVRVQQLKNVDLYLLDARNRIAEARRKLQDLAAEDGVSKAEAALIALKRAREQLLDPITRLRGVAQDELQLLQETAYVKTAKGGLQLGPMTPTAPADPGAPAEKDLPGWLAPALIADRQGGLRDRLEEIRGGLAAATEAPPPAPAPGAPADPKAAQQEKLLERVKAALPAVVEASTAMQAAHDALAQSKLDPAIEQERLALIALSRAIEQFADLKQTVELAYADQQTVVKLLGPEGAQLPAQDRAKETRDALDRNVARMGRLKELIADEVTNLAGQKAQLDQQATQPAPPPAAGSGAPAPDPKAQAEAAKQALAQQEQVLAKAEELRGQAEVALGALTKAITANQDPLTPAKDADVKLTELRKLFFSVIEHLQQLIRDQGETRDQTTVANTEDQFTREPKLPGLITRQDGHGGMAKAITDALAAQADAAGKGPPQQGAPDPKTLSAAAGEVRLAQGEMSDATRTLSKARDSKTSSESLEPGVKSQAKAIEHLEAALRLLQPPPQQNKDQQQDKQEQQQQAEKAKDKPEQPKPGGASQRARDEDARRQREKRKQDAAADPVEKDW